MDAEVRRLLGGNDWEVSGFRDSTTGRRAALSGLGSSPPERQHAHDQFVERILTATSREGRSLDEYAKEILAVSEGYGPAHQDVELYKSRRTLDLYWQRNGVSGIPGTLQVAHAFLGLRLECAQCHRHPSDVWQQDDLLSFANFFMAVRPAGGHHEVLIKQYPETHALCKAYEADEKHLGKQVKERRDGEGKKLEAEAKAARTESDQLAREIARLEGEAKQRADMASKKPAEADALNAQAAKPREEVAEKRRRLETIKMPIARYEAFQREMSQLDRRGKALGTVPSRSRPVAAVAASTPTAAT